jgi:hypothetical protein
MSKKAPARRKTNTRRKQMTPNSVILDIEINISTFIVQHVAMAYHRPLAQWNSDDMLAIAHRVAHLLPTKKGVQFSGVQWFTNHKNDAIGQLKIGVSAQGGDFPFLSACVSDCPFDVVSRCVSPSAVFTLISQSEDVIRGAVDRTPKGVNPTAGTLRNPYDEELKRPDFNEQQRLRNGAEAVAVAAARRAAGLLKKGGA